MMTESVVRTSPSTERFRPVAILETNRDKNSIFNYYSIDNERQFLEANPFLTPQEQEFYVRENVLRFLGEFVGKVPYSKISYIRKNGLRFGDIDLLAMIKKTSKLAGPNGREAMENIGIEKIYKGFAGDTPAQHALQLSPPKDWDYSFAFYFTQEHDEQLGGNKVTEYILQYDEKRNQTDRSQALLAKINPSLHYTSTNDFLTNPLINPSGLTTSRLLERIGISPQDIHRSQQFERAIREDLSVWIDKYVKNIILVTREYSTGNLPAHQYTIAVENLKTLITAIYNRATDIKSALDSNTLRSLGVIALSSDERFTNADTRMISMYSREREAVVVGGGSCAVTDSPDEHSPFVSNYDIHQTIKSGLPAEKSLLKEHTQKCPDCQQSKGDNHYHCPGCNKKYSDETHVSADKRTKQCNCGFKFNC